MFKPCLRCRTAFDLKESTVYWISTNNLHPKDGSDGWIGRSETRD